MALNEMLGDRESFVELGGRGGGVLRVVCVEAAIKFDTGSDGIKRLVSGRFEQVRVFFLRVVFFCGRRKSMHSNLYVISFCKI